MEWAGGERVMAIKPQECADVDPKLGQVWEFRVTVTAPTREGGTYG